MKCKNTNSFKGFRSHSCSIDAIRSWERRGTIKMYECIASAAVLVSIKDGIFELNMDPYLNVFYVLLVSLSESCACVTFCLLNQQRAKCGRETRTKRSWLLVQSRVGDVQTDSVSSPFHNIYTTPGAGNVCLTSHCRILALLSLLREFDLTYPLFYLSLSCFLSHTFCPVLMPLHPSLLHQH